MPTRINISKDWTNAERLRVITLIANHATAGIQLQRTIPVSYAFDLFQRINLVATATPSILEANVAGIFEGMGIERVEVK